MLDVIAQIGVFVFGVLAIVLVAKKNKWGFVLNHIDAEGVMQRFFHSLSGLSLPLPTNNGAFSL